MPGQIAESRSLFGTRYPLGDPRANVILSIFSYLSSCTLHLEQVHPDQGDSLVPIFGHHSFLIENLGDNPRIKKRNTSGPRAKRDIGSIQGNKLGEGVSGKTCS